MASKRHNPERRSWKGKSYKKGGKRVRHLRDEISRRESGATSAAAW